MEEKFLYHITTNNNIESIKYKGLIPQIGSRRLHCANTAERKSADLRISLCKKDDITSWRQSLYKKEADNNIVILKINYTGLKLKKREWINGTEIGCWENILPERIKEFIPYNKLTTYIIE